MARSAQASAKIRPPDILLPPEKFGFTYDSRGRILSGQRSESAPGDLFDRAEPRDLAIFGRPRIPGRGQLAVVVDEGPSLRAVNLEALADGFLAVVVALHQHLAGRVVAPVDLRRIELDVVVASRGGVHAPAAHAQDDLAVGHADLEHKVDRHARLLHRLGLRNGARKPVEEVALGAV